MKKFLGKFEIILTKEAKIFGIANKDKNVNITLLNCAIQIAQKSIWVTRNDLEHKDKVVDIWKHFKTCFVKILKMHKNYSENTANIVYVLNNLNL